jgi:Lrp/AsnC family transcriptional regulator for asnA, asnC and gidA
MVHKDIPAALSPELRELDELDRKLISVLKIDGRESLATIGTQIGLTGDSVKDRLDRLTAEGVIKVTCSVDPRVLGFNSIALVGVKVTGSAELIAAELTSVSEFDFVCCVSGEYDILVEVVCRDDVHLLRVVDQYLRSRPDVSSVSSHNYLAVLKFQPSGSPEEPETGAPPHPGVDVIDRKELKKRLKHARDVINAAPTLRNLCTVSPSWTGAAGQEEEKHHGAPPRKRDRKQMGKVASSHRGGKMIDLVSSSSEEEQTLDYPFDHQGKCSYQNYFKNQSYIYLIYTIINY